MEQKTQEAIDLILAQILGLAQVINNLSIQVNNLTNQNIDQIINQDNLNKDQDNSPGLFPKKDLEMNIQEVLNYIWISEKLKFQVYHAVTPYVDHVKSQGNLVVTHNEMWNFLSSKKLVRHFNRPDRKEKFLGMGFDERTKWIYNTLCNIALSERWKEDAEKYFSAAAETSSPSIDETLNPEPSTVNIEPGLSDFEFRRNGVRYYYDETEKRDIEIPEDFEPRPDAEAWLNTHSGWMHG